MTEAIDHPYLRGVRMANLRARYPAEPQPERTISGFFLRFREGDVSGAVIDGVVSEYLHLLRELSYAEPLAERLCRMVLMEESELCGDGWYHWQHASEHSADASLILGYMASRGYVDLHESIPLGWRWAGRERS